MSHDCAECRAEYGHDTSWVSHTHEGLWSTPGVPHRGWECLYVEDLEEPSMICEMCGKQEIRYVHHMEHRDYPKRLMVGCICAGHMEGNKLSEARKREDAAKRASKRHALEKERAEAKKREDEAQRAKREAEETAAAELRRDEAQRRQRLQREEDERRRAADARRREIDATYAERAHKRRRNAEMLHALGIGIEQSIAAERALVARSQEAGEELLAMLD